MAFGNELDERQLKAIELLAIGETISSTANIVGVNRKTISEWKKQDKFKVELDRQVTELKSNVEKKILSNINPMMDKLIKIALKSSSDKTSLDAIIYALNRVLGTPTNKTQEVNDGNNKNSAPVNIEEMLCQINVDNVLDSKGNDPI
ncbi:carbon monoxide dehydrogenase [Clostridium celatum]|uniref:phBC6A51 family helix-turn-helix protein n=1 Tax=Clostridium celatum TaxID=36834 RepID=UPI001EEAB92B|nr:phBC6A51 family helix-turn-helix protein [Clostridium celatum]MCE9656488.1 carbon monoxide dehydrogenase [Clostridium celatum]